LFERSKSELVGELAAVISSHWTDSKSIIKFANSYTARDILMKEPEQFIHQSEFMTVTSVESSGRSEEYDDMAYDRDALPSELPNDSRLVTNEFSDSRSDGLQMITSCQGSY